MKRNPSQVDLPVESILNRLDPYVFGSMSLGHEDVPFETRLSMARYAMERCGWFHTSHKYGSTMDVLAQAFREWPMRIPKCIFKLSGDSLDEVRRQIDLQLEKLGVEQISIGQLHVGGALAADFNAGGKCLDGLRAIKEEGLVGAFTLEVHPWTSHIALDHLRGGQGRDIIEGYSFYFNPLQRYALNDLFALVLETRRPILSIRTVGGGPVEKQAARPERPEDFMQKRSAELLPVYAQSDCANWVDFSMNFVLSQPGVICTIGSCSTPAHLDDYLAVLKQERPSFNPSLTRKILALQTKWSDEKDVHAPEWSM